MEKFDSITHFLQSGEFDYRVYDMGRKVSRIPNDSFENIENQNIHYPYPFQRKAWLALLFWDKRRKSNEPVIWFVKFPIDELGFLQLEARDGFLIGLLEQAGKNIQAKQAGSSVQDELNESPYAFKPQADRLAMFHALATVELGVEPSQYYQHAREYLKGDAGYEQWQFLGLQGITDIVARLSWGDNEQLLLTAIPHMPDVPLIRFSQAMEHIAPDGLLAECLLARLNKALDNEESDNALVSALLRSLSSSKPDSQRITMLMNVLNKPCAEDIEVIVAVSGRAWQDLKDSALLKIFVESLSRQNQDAFNAVLIDLMMIPDMKEHVLNVMRNADRSAELNEKLSGFMKLMQC